MRKKFCNINSSTSIIYDAIKFEFELYELIDNLLSLDVLRPEMDM